MSLYHEKKTHLVSVRDNIQPVFVPHILYMAKWIALSSLFGDNAYVQSVVFWLDKIVVMVIILIAAAGYSAIWMWIACGTWLSSYYLLCLQLTEAELDMYSDSDDEGTGDDEDEDMNETNIKQLESLQLEKVVPLSL